MLSLSYLSFAVLSIAVQASAKAFIPPTALLLFSRHPSKRQQIPDSAVPDACKSQCSDLIILTNSCGPLGVTEKANCFCESTYLDAYATCLPCIETNSPNALGGSSASDLIESLKSSCTDLAGLQSFVSDASSLTFSATDSSSPSVSVNDLQPTSSLIASATKAASSAVASVSAKVASATAALASSTATTTRAATGAGTRRIGGERVGLVISILGGLAAVGGMVVLG